ncbi:hypothetical protein E2C01_006464 [Portunus trituberculatus]|uniref:Uncharacterized protein n=1 Tax=Portunus trituberculatus TaxID=210409 RepID=A0A5B7CWE7_PORTR|nr:hypothetical protein [Portunus trituberculatus]
MLENEKERIKKSLFFACGGLRQRRISMKVDTSSEEARRAVTLGGWLAGARDTAGREQWALRVRKSLVR